MGESRFDPFAAAAALLSIVMLFVYLSIIGQQGGEPAPWAVAVLLVGAGAAGYGANRTAPHRVVSLAIAAVLLLALGMLAILSIGLPILAAAALCLVALLRRRPTAAH